MVISFGNLSVRSVNQYSTRSKAVLVPSSSVVDEPSESEALSFYSISLSENRRFDGKFSYLLQGVENNFRLRGLQREVFSRVQICVVYCVQ